MKYSTTFLVPVFILFATTVFAEQPRTKPAKPLQPKPAQSKPAQSKPAQSKPAQSKPAPTRSLVYKKIGDVELVLHLFEPEGHTAEAKRPAIVFFFGGGWVGGTPSQFYPHCDALAKRGWVAASAEYRIASKHKTTPFECVADGKSAVRYMRAHAAELGIDPEKLCAGGGSAGGHVAASVGVIPGHEEPGEDTKVSSRPLALVLFNPVIDTSKKGYGYNKLKERYRELSPVEHVDESDPPTLIFHGEADTTVPYANVVDFAARMKKAGNECEVMNFPGAKHGFFNYGRDGGDAYEKTTARMFEFLDRVVK